VRFFIDNNIAPKLARGFNEFVKGEHEVLHLRDRFAGHTSDVVWMRGLAAESGWVILSGDVAIGRNPHEVAAWKEAGHTIFFLKSGWTNIQFWQQVQKLAKCFPDIMALAQRAKPGDSFIVTVNGKIEPD
jgi:PIN like domain